MKNVLVCLIFTLCVKFSFSCSCSPTVSFCNAHNGFSISISAQIIDTFSTGTTLKILSLLNGTESRDTIKVFDLSAPPYNMCSEENKARYGKLGDTVILSLYRIDTIINVWDEIGEYSAVGFTCNTNILWVSNSIISGRISGFEYCHIFNNCLNSYNYSDFIDEWSARKFNCGTWLSNREMLTTNEKVFYPNPFDKLIFINADANHFSSIEMFDLKGRKIEIITENNEVRPISDLSCGFYVLKAISKDGKSTYQRLLKTENL